MLQIKKEVTHSSPLNVALITTVRNEIKLIDAFFKHYRALGIKEFYVIDNASNDGTLEYLLDQPDCTVYFTTDSFETSNYGMNWINKLQNDHCKNRWALHVDCDEHLVYREMTKENLPEFVSRLDSLGFDSCYATMIDMYHDKILTSDTLKPYNIYDIFKFFDRDYLVRIRPKPPWSKSNDSRIQVIGGPRVRILSNFEKEMSRGWISYFLHGKIDRFIKIVPISLLPFLFKIWPRHLPALHKTPLNKICDKITTSEIYIDSHNSNGINKSPEMLGLLHFKFVNELMGLKTAKTLQLNRYRRGLEREQLRLAFQSHQNGSLMYKGSIEYRNVLDLVNSGIIGHKPLLEKR